MYGIFHGNFHLIIELVMLWETTHLELCMRHFSAMRPCPAHTHYHIEQFQNYNLVVTSCESAQTSPNSASPSALVALIRQHH